MSATGTVASVRSLFEHSEVRIATRRTDCAWIYAHSFWCCAPTAVVMLCASYFASYRVQRQLLIDHALEANRVCGQAGQHHRCIHR